MSRAYDEGDTHDDDPLEQDVDDDSDDWAEMQCPNCGAAVAEDTQKCPRCGDWITPVAPEGRGPKRVIFVGAVVLMAAIMAWLALRS